MPTEKYYLPKYLPYIVFSIILYFSSTSCFFLRDCSNDVYGKYVLINNPEAENYLILRRNGTFEHFYSEQNIVLKNEGNWKKSNDGYCVLEFDEWKDYNEKGMNYEEYGNYVLWINGDYLDITPDGTSPNSFKRTE
tara:strand:+ start:54 stop:461 length:408 start_codon:yes stop_codon:yes gene_type:complete